MPLQLAGSIQTLQPFWRLELIVHIAISVLPGTHLHLSEVSQARVKWHNIETLSQQSFCPTMRGDKHDTISLTTCTKMELNPHDRHANAKRHAEHALTIAPRYSLYYLIKLN